MELKIKPFSLLTAWELHEILRLRVDVFVVEQNCPYPELDGLDPSCWHLWLEDVEGVQAYLRALPPGLRFPEASLGRVASRRRRQGLATRLLREGIRLCREELGAGPILLEAQVYARELYEKLGFRQCSPEFLEDGIPHIQMRLE